MATPTAVAPSVIRMMVANNALPLAAVAAQSAQPGAQPPVNPSSPTTKVGAMHADGSWASSPGWGAQKIGVGQYQVWHNIGSVNFTVSPALIGVTGPGCISVVSMDPQQLTVQITDGSQNPIDLPWAFTMSVIG